MPRELPTIPGPRCSRGRWAGRFVVVIGEIEEGNPFFAEGMIRYNLIGVYRYTFFLIRCAGIYMIFDYMILEIHSKTTIDTSLDSR